MMKKRTQKQLLGVAMSGLLSTLLRYGLYLLFYQFTSYQFAYFISYFISIIVLYFMNLWVFKRSIALNSLLKFPFVYGLQYLIGAGSLELLVDLGIPKVFAPILVVILLFPLTFLLNKLIFKR